MKSLEKIKVTILTKQEQKNITGGSISNGAVWTCVTAKGKGITFPGWMDQEVYAEIDAYNNSCCFGDIIVGCDYEFV